MSDHSGPSRAKVNQLRVRHLRLAQALVGAGSLHRAAKLLYVSQPTASAMLKELELAFGGQLFERTRKGVTPSLRGHAALARLQAMLGELDTLSSELAPGRTLATVRIGCMRQTFFGPLQEYLRNFIAASTCRVEIVDSAYPDLIQRLQRGELDCVLGRMPANLPQSLRRGDYVYQPLYEYETCVLAGPGHPLLRKRKLDLRDLTQYEWVLTKSAHILKDAFAAAGLEPPKVRIETPSFVLSLTLLRIGELLTTVPSDVGLEQQRLGLARVLPFKLPQLLPPVAFIAQQSSMLNPHVLLLCNTIRKVADDRRFSTLASRR